MLNNENLLLLDESAIISMDMRQLHWFNYF